MNNKHRVAVTLPCTIFQAPQSKHLSDIWNVDFYCEPLIIYYILPLHVHSQYTQNTHTQILRASVITSLYKSCFIPILLAPLFMIHFYYYKLNFHFARINFILLWIWIGNGRGNHECVGRSESIFSHDIHQKLTET